MNHQVRDHSLFNKARIGPQMVLLANPHAGRGRARRNLPRIVAELVRELPETTVHLQETTSFADAERRTREAVATASPGDSLVVVGGDGMAHLGVNACAGTEVTLGVIPAGTGNDFCRGVGIPTALRPATAAIIAGRTTRIDTNLVRGRLSGGDTRRHVGCTVSTGYDARVNDHANRMRASLGALAYGWVALRELAAFSPLPYRLTIDGEVREIDAMLVAVSNSTYFGGGMQIAPRASVTDGELDVTIIHALTRPQLLRLLPTIYTGGFVKRSEVELLRARSVTVDGEGLVGMADGEPLGDVPLQVDVAPESLAIHVPAQFPARGH